MPLSEHEQRMLDQIEQALYAEDPKFASSVKGARLSKPSRRRRIQGVVVALVGIAMLPLGVAAKATQLGGFPVLSVLGFLLMFAGVLIAVTGFRVAPDEADDPSGDSTQSKKAGGRSSFTQRMEERFRDRFEDR